MLIVARSFGTDVANVRNGTMTTSVQLQSSDTIGAAFGQMESAGVTELPVVDAKRRVLGIIREVDLRKFIARSGRAAMFAVTVGSLLAA